MTRTDAELMQEMSRLRCLAGDGESSLAPLLRGFHDSGFQAQLQQFVAQRAAAFTVACPDGSHPLAWTQFHNEYREMFEAQLAATCGSIGMSTDQLHEYCAWLHDGAVALDDDSEDLYRFVEALTSSEDYGKFLALMFAEVQRQQQAAAYPPTQEIEVTVPEGVGVGQALAVEYLGSRFEVQVPEGCLPGRSFRVAVTLPVHNPAVTAPPV